MKRVIGIGGLKRSGKSTLADYITMACAMRGWQVQEVSWAQPIKEMLQEVFRYEVPYSTFIHDDRKQDKVEVAPGVYMTVREMLQKVGTECFRDVIHKDFWVARGMAKIKSASADIVIVPDVRFPNELIALGDVPCTTIYIDRPKFTRELDLHASETELVNMRNHFDTEFINTEDSLEDLQEFATELVASI